MQLTSWLALVSAFRPGGARKGLATEQAREATTSSRDQILIFSIVCVSHRAGERASKSRDSSDHKSRQIATAHN